MDKAMGKVLAIFNTKGGVGKSTTAMIVAETAAAHERKKVLVIDADSQISVSTMITPATDGISNTHNWEWAEKNNHTIVDYFTQALEDGKPPDVAPHFVIGSVSDVVEAAGLIDLLPGSMDLALFESDYVHSGYLVDLETSVKWLLESARAKYDLILIDCPPGVTPLTLMWLEHSDALLTPVSPNFLGVRSLFVIKRLKDRFDRENRSYPRRVGTLITLDGNTPREQVFKGEIIEQDRKAGILPFSRQVPKLTCIQTAAEYDLNMRGYLQKYPRAGNHQVSAINRDLTRELVQRL